MKVKFRGEVYELKPTGKRRTTKGGIDINGNETESRSIKQWGLYDETGSKIYNAGRGADDSGNVKIFGDNSKCIGSAHVIPIAASPVP